MGCCTPRDCFTCSPRPPTVSDGCMCGCGYLNGGFLIAAAQTLIFIGSFFSAAAIGDCAFATVAVETENPYLANSSFRRIGYITFQNRTDTCYWYTEGQNNPEDQIQWYFEFLGSDWQVGRIFGCIALAGSGLFWFYSLSFCCSAQFRAVRYFNFFILSLLLTCFQGLTFLVFGSPFCEEYDCEFDRSAGFSAGAMGCFFLAGTCFLCMKDYPGQDAVVAAQTQKATEEKPDEEAPIVAAAAAPLEKEEEKIEEEDPNNEEHVAEAETEVVDEAEVPEEQEAVEEPAAADKEAAVVEESEPTVEEATEDVVEEEVVEEEVMEEEIVEEEIVEEEVVEDSNKPEAGTEENAEKVPDDVGPDDEVAAGKTAP